MYCLMQGVLRLGQDADEILLVERGQLDPDRKPALELGDEVGRLGHVEGAGADEEDVVGLDQAVARVDGRAFDDRQQVALDALAADLGPVARFAAGDLVQLVQEDDARVLDALDGQAGDLVHVDQPPLLFVEQVLPGLVDFDFPLLGLSAHEAGHELLDLDADLLDARVGEDLEGRSRSVP